MPSTVIDQIEYDPENRTLKIVYISGQTYIYKEVPENIYKELKASQVKGRYLQFFIKDKFQFEKIAPA
ncbi:MAG: KTSC domain-containing protein [Sphingobacteriales bacterium]